MTEAPVQVTPPPNEPLDLPPVETELERLKRLAREYGQSVVIGVGLAAVIALGLYAFNQYRQTSAERAANLLNTARSPEQFQQILSRYGSTPVAPVAQLALAAQYFNAGQFDQAQAAYRTFAQKYPQHPMLEAAELGQAQCLESGGRLEQALGAYAAFLQAHPQHYLLAPATLGKGHCLEQLGRYDEAKALYEDFQVKHPESAWAGQFESAVQFAAKAKRATAAPAKPVPAAPVAPVAPAASAKK